MIGTLPGACYAGGMTSFLYSKGIRIFDYAKFAEPLRERMRDCAQAVNKAAGIEIEHVNKSHIRKEGLVAQVLAQRGDAPGLVSQPRVPVGTEQKVKGLNFFDPPEQRLLKVLRHGEFNIHGWRHQWPADKFYLLEKWSPIGSSRRQSVALC